MDTQNTYKTDDLLFAAFLLTNNIKLVNVVEDFPRHFSFVLSDSKKCQELKISFLNNAPAPARQLFSQREMLLSEIKMKNQYGK